MGQQMAPGSICYQDEEKIHQRCLENSNNSGFFMRSRIISWKITNFAPWTQKTKSSPRKFISTKLFLQGTKLVLSPWKFTDTSTWACCVNLLDYFWHLEIFFYPWTTKYIILHNFTNLWFDHESELRSDLWFNSVVLHKGLVCNRFNHAMRILFFFPKFISDIYDLIPLALANSPRPSWWCLPTLCTWYTTILSGN
jgi:hypothetical protein